MLPKILDAKNTVTVCEIPRRNSDASRRIIAHLLLLICVSASSLQAIDLASFRPSSARITTSGFSLRASADAYSSDVADTSDRETRFEARPAWAWLTEQRSDNNEFRIEQQAGLYWLSSRGSYLAYRDSSEAVGIGEDLTVTWRRYVGRSDFLFELSPAVNGAVIGRGATILRPIEYFLGGQASLTAGIGYGRLRDAAPLMKAIRLTGILHDCAVLSRAPADSELVRLADVISRSWRLFEIHDRAAKFYYDSLEASLLQSGLIAAPLPPFALMRLDDGLMVGTDERDVGSRILVGARDSCSGSRLLDRQGDTAWKKSSQGSLGRIHPFLECRYARPFGLRWTTDGGLTYDLALTSRFTRHTLQVSVGGAYQISNRLLAEADVKVTPVWQRDSAPTAEPNNSLAAELTAGFDLYLTDRLKLTTEAALSYGNSRLPRDRETGTPMTALLSIRVEAGPQWALHSGTGIW
jgi:hypothetical protein